eukprot:361777-Chlamydomonas_euryale.AAC.4
MAAHPLPPFSFPFPSPKPAPVSAAPTSALHLPCAGARKVGAAAAAAAVRSGRQVSFPCAVGPCGGRLLGVAAAVARRRGRRVCCRVRRLPSADVAADQRPPGRCARRGRAAVACAVAVATRAPRVRRGPGCVHGRAARRAADVGAARSAAVAARPRVRQLCVLRAGHRLGVVAAEPVGACCAGQRQAQERVGLSGWAGLQLSQKVPAAQGHAKRKSA